MIVQIKSGVFVLRCVELKEGKYFTWIGNGYGGEWKGRRADNRVDYQKQGHKWHSYANLKQMTYGTKTTLSLSACGCMFLFAHIF